MANLAIKGYFDKPEVQNELDKLLGGNKKNVITSVMQVVNGNDSLKNSSPKSIFNAVAMAAVLDMPINQNLGMAYIVPFKGEAQFQIGWKGFVQLAIRSGEYKTIGATEIFENQIVSNNPLTGYIFDFNVKDKGASAGFAASFILKNGFEKVLFMTNDEMKSHGKKFSKTYDKNFSVWKQNFSAMGLKTVVKLLLSKYGPKSLDMQKALSSDQSVVEDYKNDSFKYPDNDGSTDKKSKIEEVMSVEDADFTEEKEEYI